MSPSPIATSTPKNRAEPPLSVLKESQNLRMNKESRRRPVPKKKNADFRQSPAPKVNAKENAKKNQTNIPPRQRRENDEKKEAQRRQQALEAMQILERRRLRMTQQNLAEEMEQLSLQPKTDEVNDLLSQKRQDAKRLKEKRILAHLAEQEAKKKKESNPSARANHSSTPKYLVRSQVSSPRSNPVFPNFRPKHRYAFKPKRPLPPWLPQLPEEDEEEEKAMTQSICYQIPSYNPFKTPRKLIIRYSKDEIRNLNPYGYYFM